MIFLVDIDSVLNNLSVTWEQAHNNDNPCGTKIDLCNITKWDLSDTCGCGKDVYKYLKRRDIFIDAPVLDFAVEGLRILHDLYKVKLVTASDNPEAIIGKYIWLEKHFPFISTKDVIFSFDKSLIYGDVIIDDNIANLYHPHVKYRLLFTQPWNKVITEDEQRRLNQYPSSVERVDNWTQIINLVTR